MAAEAATVPVEAPEAEPGVIRLAPPRATPAARRVLDRYVLDRRLGAGGFGAVWLARDEKLERWVAVKEVPLRGDAGDGEAHGARTQREAVAAARLNHPGIVALYEAGSDAHASYLVSELVEGRTVAQLTAGGELSDRDVVRVGIALCDALGHAHARGVIHRDVKPQNVIVPDQPDSEAGIAKLTDFGVARLVGDDPLTRTGDVVGTLAYMAPEQAQGQQAGAPADVYALALVLYEALAGVNPVRGAGPADTARRLGARLPSLRRLRRDLPAPLCLALDAALVPEPASRIRLDDLRTALWEHVEEVSDEGGTLVAPLRRARGGPRTARLACAALTAAAAALALLLAPHPVPAVAPLLVACVGLGTLVLPRLTWLAAAVAAVTWYAVAVPGHGGEALVIGLGMAACPLLLPRDGRLWSLPLLAPLLGLIGLAGAFPALAGSVRGTLRRAALGALGFWWLALAEPLLHRSLYLGPAEGSVRPARFAGSVGEAAAHAVWPVLDSGAGATMLLWALAAAVLPLLVRGRSVGADLAGAAAWAFALWGGTHALGQALGGAVAHPQPVGAVPAIALGAVSAVVWQALRGGSEPWASHTLPEVRGLVP